MKELVFLEPNKIDNEPFTTSDIIAECAELNYRSVQRRIEKHESALEEFGRVRFEITPFETKGGLQNKKIYYLNEQQATLLVTFLKNTPAVVEFKIELVRQFYAMREELFKRRTYRLELKPIRREMTDVIKEVDESKWAYKKYTDLAYKSVLGMNAAQVRKLRNAKPHDVAIDYMTADEINAVSKAQNRISVLLEMDMDYEQIKELMLNRRIVGHLIGKTA